MLGPVPLGERRGGILALRLDRFDLTGRPPKGGRPVCRVRVPAVHRVSNQSVSRSTKERGRRMDSSASRSPRSCAASGRRLLLTRQAPVASRTSSFLDHVSHGRAGMGETTITRLGDSGIGPLSANIAWLPWHGCRSFGFAPVPPICLRSCPPPTPLLPTPIAVSRDIPPPGSSARIRHAESRFSRKTLIHCKSKP